MCGMPSPATESSRSAAQAASPDSDARAQDEQPQGAAQLAQSPGHDVCAVQMADAQAVRSSAAALQHSTRRPNGSCRPAETTTAAPREGSGAAHGKWAHGPSANQLAPRRSGDMNRMVGHHALFRDKVFSEDDWSAYMSAGRFVPSPKILCVLRRAPSGAWRTHTTHAPAAALHFVRLTTLHGLHDTVQTASSIFHHALKAAFTELQHNLLHRH